MFGVIVLLVSLILLWQSYQIAGLSALSSPGAFPLAVSAVMVIAALVVVINNARRPHQDVVATRTWIVPPVVMVFTALVIGYSLLLDVLGFLPTSLLFLIVAIHFLHRGSLIVNGLIALVALMVIYVVFRLVFTVVLPEGIVPEREILAWLERLIQGGGR